MKKMNTTYDDLIKMAERYCVADNALFISAAKQYSVQCKVIEKIKEALDSDDLVTEKTYLKGEKNLYANPLVRELPKHADSANKTLQSMLDIISKLGHEKSSGSKLSDLMNE